MLLPSWCPRSVSRPQIHFNVARMMHSLSSHCISLSFLCTSRSFLKQGKRRQAFLLVEIVSRFAAAICLQASPTRKRAIGRAAIGLRPCDHVMFCPFFFNRGRMVPRSIADVGLGPSVQVQHAYSSSCLLSVMC